MRQLGKHTYQLEGDIHFIKLDGDFELREIIEFHELLAEGLRKSEPVYVIGNMKDAGIIQPEGRRWISHWHQQHRISGVALFGSSFMTRAMWTLLIRAIVVLRRNELALTSVATEQEAREWVDQQRLLRQPQ
jgi:hypothetical protein